MDTWVGLDISKSTFDVGWITEDGEFCHLKLDNNVQGFRKLLDSVPADAKFVMEATGNYHLRCALALNNAGRHVSVANPIAVKRLIQSDLRRCKNDKADSFYIARYGMEKRPAAWKPPSKAALQARELIVLMDAVQSSLGKLRNNEESFKQNDLKNDIARRYCKRMIKQLEKELDDLEAELEKVACVEWGEEIEILDSIPGVGKSTACHLMAKVEDFNRFKNSRQLISWMGMSPFNSQSGSSLNKHGGITKMGCSRLRTRLYMCTLSASCKGKGLAMKKRLEEKGKAKKVIFVALINQILRTAYALVTKGVKYNPNFLQSTP